mmetsp:Transcript_3453/g.6240  ORF Transcript_3453/g.6240 Transcript_3453/m.6240 type:complete len:781 (-) Transcript_3453:96-2438(-)
MLGARAGMPWLITWFGVSLALGRGNVDASLIVSPGRVEHALGPTHGQQLSHASLREHAPENPQQHTHAAVRKHASEHRQVLSQVQLDGAGQVAPLWAVDPLDPLDHLGDIPILNMHMFPGFEEEFHHFRQPSGQNAEEGNRTQDIVAILPNAVDSSLHMKPRHLLLGFPDRGSAKRPTSDSIKVLLVLFGVAYAVFVFMPSSQSGVPGGQALLSRTPQLGVTGVPAGSPRLTTRNPAEATWQRLRQQPRSPWFSGASSRKLYGAFCSHGMYTGAQSTTWLPFLLLLECELLWPEHQLLLLGFAGLAYGVGAVFGPAASALICMAVRHWGQAGCRLALRVGIMMSAISMVACCFAASRGQAFLFLLAIMCWSLGDTLVRATLDVFCGKLLGVENCQELYELRLSSVLVGGLFGCILIIFSICLHHYWLYFVYLGGLLCSAFCILLALNTERTEGAVGNVTKVGRPPWTSWTFDLVQAYTSPFLLRSGFPRVCFAYLLFGVACAPLLCMLLFVRDLTFSGNSDDQTIKAIFGLSSLFGVLNGFGSAPGGAYGFIHFVWVDTLPRNANFATTQLMVFSGLLLLPPIIGSFGDDVVSQLMCYAVSACSGAAFGSIHRTFLECLPRLIPSGFDSVQVAVFYDMCKRLGTGIGLALIGYLVTYGCESSLGHHGDVHARVYTRGGYFVMCTFSSLFAVTSALCMLSAPAVVSGEQRALQAADECFETTAGLPAPRIGADQAESEQGQADPEQGDWVNGDVYIVNGATAAAEPIMMVRSASGNNLVYV